jgi:hypothetical protein
MARTRTRWPFKEREFVHTERLRPDPRVIGIIQAPATLEDLVAYYGHGVYVLQNARKSFKVEIHH